MKKTLKIAISILLICTMALALFACTKKDTPATPGGTATPAAPGGSAAPDSPGGSDAPDAPIVPSRDTINIALSQDGGTLDPFFMLATDIQSTMSMVYEGLYYYNSAGEVIWLL
ncbi:MAG: hypothetical protein LBN99_05605, partial [Oscillospiraceae bacterium]|nr:hypothetical protein [Oscillospiraceae bacterium]